MVFVVNWPKKLHEQRNALKDKVETHLGENKDKDTEEKGKREEKEDKENTRPQQKKDKVWITAIKDRAEIKEGKKSKDRDNDTEGHNRKKSKL